MPRKNKLTEKCMNPNCTNTQHSRGLCSRCYCTVNSLIRDGICTEKQMIEAGRILPSQNVNPSKDWLLDGVK